MNSGKLNSATMFLRYALLAGAAAYVVVFLVVALIRIRYPFELEWMEGGVLIHVKRILAGQKMYVRPTLEFITFLYTPLYYYLSAAAARVFGVGFMPLRLISLTSSLGSFFIIYFMVKEETGSVFAGVLASCLFGATYNISGSWFDVGRGDSLFLFLLLAGFYLIRFKPSPERYFLAGILISLSFLSKQTAVVICLPMMLYCLYLNPRNSVYFIGVIAATTALSTILLDYVHDGWYTYYTFYIPKRLDIIEGMFADFWTKDLLSPLPIACIMAVLYLFGELRNRVNRERLFYPAMAVGMLVGPWLSRMKHGSYLNIPMPSHALIAVLFGLATHKALTYVQTVPVERRKPLELAIYLVCILQFAHLAYNPLSLIPTAGDADAGRNLVDRIARIEGEVFIPYHGYLAVMAGKRSYAHAIAISDVIRTAQGGQTEADLVREMWRAFRNERFDAIILDSRGFLDSWLHKTDYEGYCTDGRQVFERSSVFWPVTGARIRPQIIMRRCSDQQHISDRGDPGVNSSTPDSDPFDAVNRSKGSNSE